MRELYVKVPEHLLEESPEVLWHYCRLYMTALSWQKSNLSKYARENKLSYTTVRRLWKVAQEQITINQPTNQPTNGERHERF